MLQVNAEGGAGGESEDPGVAGVLLVNVKGGGGDGGVAGVTEISGICGGVMTTTVPGYEDASSDAVRGGESSGV